MQVIIHKCNNPETPPKVSIILLDWSVRERFHTLDWLAVQSVPREDYELIWIELYDRLVPEAMEKAEVVITCNQQGRYQKHVGYNVGLLHARGQIITICDSDAVYPPDFIASILNSFQLTAGDEPIPLVLMHYEWRTTQTYPDDLSDISQLSQYKWYNLWPNVGACMSVRKIDAVRFGGFDEHPSFRDYMCGPYDLGWRLVNAGIPEIWHDESVTLWHFAHPDPVASFGQKFSFKLWREIAHPHLEGHALTAVEAFSTGRLLPLQENPEVHRLRMAQRQIGTTFEEKYAWLDPAKFSKWEQLKLQLFNILLGQPYLRPILQRLAKIRRLLQKEDDRQTKTYATLPELVMEYKGYNVVLYQDSFYALSRSLGHVDLTQLDQRTLSEYQASGECFVGRSPADLLQIIVQLPSPPLHFRIAWFLVSSTRRVLGSQNYEALRARLLKCSFINRIYWNFVLAERRWGLQRAKACDTLPLKRQRFMKYY